MDLVGFEKTVFDEIKKEVQALADKINYEGELQFIPVAAKDGDNVVHFSTRMDWYQGATLLEHLEGLSIHDRNESLPARFPVQFVIRPHTEQHHDYRGYAGRLTSGRLQKGEDVIVLPSGTNAKISRITRAEKELEEAVSGQSISIELDGDVDVSRGNMIVAANETCSQINQFNATICWMNDQLLSAGRTMLLQHGVNQVKAKILSLQGKLDIETLSENKDANHFALNDIGRVVIKTAKPMFADSYSHNPRNGAFILIDEFTNNTVGVGFVEDI
jgi:sulfate adenylyltransferase subunit 1